MATDDNGRTKATTAKRHHAHIGPSRNGEDLSLGPGSSHEQLFGLWRWF